MNKKQKQAYIDTLVYLTGFADHHGVKLEIKGSVGFGRECVGFTNKTNGNYIDYNPSTFPNHDVYPLGNDDRLLPPSDVNAYHKHDCLCVLAEDGDHLKALHGLRKWCEKIEAKGNVLIQRYATGATGVQAQLSGTFGYAVTITN
jgi:hypothetical protein